MFAQTNSTFIEFSTKVGATYTRLNFAAYICHNEFFSFNKEGYPDFQANYELY